MKRKTKCTAGIHFSTISIDISKANGRGILQQRNRILQQCYQADVIYQQQQQQKDGKRINKKKESITRVMKIINA